MFLRHSHSVLDLLNPVSHWILASIFPAEDGAFTFTLSPTNPSVILTCPFVFWHGLHYLLQLAGWLMATSRRLVVF